MKRPAALRTRAAPCERRTRGAVVEGWLRRLRRLAADIARAAGRVSLFQRFALLSLVILIVGAYVIGSYVAGEIKGRVIQRTSAITALYVDSFVSPHLQDLRTQESISPDHYADLDSLLSGSPLGEKIVAFKIWNTSGRVLYANNDRRLIGRQFAISDDLRGALNGNVQASIEDLNDEENQFERPYWDRLLEVYVPVHAQKTGEVIGVSEFYQDPSDLESEVSSSQQNGWLIVGGATAAMYLLLVGMVRGASTTIARQHGRLEQLARQNADLADRVRRAAAKKSETDERLLMRIAQDMHDGPAQDISLALLRLESVTGGQVGPPSSPTGPDDAQLMRTALQSALDEIRQIASDLRLPELEHLSLPQVVEKAVQEHRGKTGNRVTLTATPALPPVDLPVKIALYRVVQEALTNAYLHAGADEQEVEITFAQDVMRLEVRDRGVGLDGSAERRKRGGGHAPLGIRGMRERVEMLGGTLEVRSQPGAGTTVRAVLPLERKESPGG